MSSSQAVGHGCWLMPMLMLSMLLCRTAASPVVTGYPSHAEDLSPGCAAPVPKRQDDGTDRQARCGAGLILVPFVSILCPDCHICNASVSFSSLFSRDPLLIRARVRHVLCAKSRPCGFSLLVARLAGTLTSSHEPMFQASSWGYPREPVLYIRYHICYSVKCSRPIVAQCQFCSLFTAAATESIRNHHQQHSTP